MAGHLKGPYILVGNKIVKSEKAIEAKLDVSRRAQRRKSKRVRVVKPNLSTG